MIFIDTSAFVARYLTGDQHSVAAMACWTQLLKAGTPCATSSLVLAETITLLARRAGCHYAALNARTLVTSRAFTVLRPGPSEELRAADLLEKLSNPRISFTDCLSFVLMAQHKIREAFTFDAHFRHAGFRVRPS